MLAAECDASAICDVSAAANSSCNYTNFLKAPILLACCFAETVIYHDIVEHLIPTNERNSEHVIMYTGVCNDIMHRCMCVKGPGVLPMTARRLDSARRSALQP